MWEHMWEKVWNSLKCLKKFAFQCIQTALKVWKWDFVKSKKVWNQIKLLTLKSLGKLRYQGLHHWCIKFYGKIHDFFWDVWSTHTTFSIVLLGSSSWTVLYRMKAVTATLMWITETWEGSSSSGRGTMMSPGMCTWEAVSGDVSTSYSGTTLVVKFSLRTMSWCMTGQREKGGGV